VAIDTPDSAQTIAYPADGARPHRRDTDALAPHVIVLFGATGDLAKRKLLPGMAYLVQSALAPEIRVVGTSLENLTDDEFRKLTKEAVDSFGTHKLTKEQWDSFASRISYVPQGAGPEALAAAVTAAEEQLGPEVRRQQ
jgi:glucose-6-phosphate 1-dehydrogenase